MLVVTDARLLQVQLCYVAAAGDVTLGTGVWQGVHGGQLHQVAQSVLLNQAAASFVRMNCHTTKTPDTAEVKFHGFLTSVMDEDIRPLSAESILPPGHLYTHVCFYIRLYLCMSVCVYACMYVCMYVCMCVCMHVYMSVCVYVCVYVFFYLFIYCMLHYCK